MSDPLVDHVALLRGINVGQAKRVPMADLRRIVVELGGIEPQTVLNSGNVVFGAPRSGAGSASGAGSGSVDGTALRAAVLAATGVDSEVVLLTGDEFRAVAAANPLRRDDREPKRLGVAFAAADLDHGAEALVRDIAPEELIVADRAVYQWLPNGVLASPVTPAFWRALGATVTARNGATVLKIVALLDARAAR